jgi:hypothetical protein
MSVMCEIAAPFYTVRFGSAPTRIQVMIVHSFVLHGGKRQTLLDVDSSFIIIVFSFDIPICSLAFSSLVVPGRDYLITAHI